MDPCNVTTLKSLKQDFGAVEKYKDGFKRALDEQFVKMCCKKRRALSCGETDREMRSWMLSTCNSWTISTAFTEDIHGYVAIHEG